MRADLIDPKIAEPHGRIVKLMGDGMLAEFASVVEAVRAAAEVQRAVAERNAGLPEDERIEFRVGVNLGDVVIDGDDIQGDGVNVAARLEGLAEPGGICISGSVHEQVRDRLDLPFEDLGEHQVKNIDRPVRVYRVLPAGQAAPVKLPAGAWRRALWPAIIAGGVVLAIFVGLGLWFWLPLEPTGESTLSEAPVLPVETEPLAPNTDKPSIAVLPFANLSTDPEQAYFADGMAEDIITDLAKISGLFVAARNSSFAYKGKQIDLRVVARELGVRYLLEGSVRRAGDQVRVNAQLIDATTGGHLWAERYDGTLADVFYLQDRITNKITKALQVALTPDEAEQVQIGQNYAW